ncbi:hypothetical protein AB4K20DRAFT_1904124 [Rhizopus microsporus]
MVSILDIFLHHLESRFFKSKLLKILRGLGSLSFSFFATFVMEDSKSHIRSLYTICLEYIVNHNESLTALDHVPFQPFASDIIHGIFQSKKRLEKTTLSIFGKTYGQYLLRHIPPEWTSIQFSYFKLAGSSAIVLGFISQHFPMFVTRLDMSYTDIQDKHISLLNGFKHLSVLNLRGARLLSDSAVSDLSAMVIYKGLPALEEISLSDIPSITDRSLKHIGKMESLCYIDLTSTSVTGKVADMYLIKLGFTKTDEKRHQQQPPPCIKLHQDILDMVLASTDFVRGINMPIKPSTSLSRNLCYKRAQTHVEQVQKRKLSYDDNKRKKVRNELNLDVYFDSIVNEFLQD